MRSANVFRNESGQRVGVGWHGEIAYCIIAARRFFCVHGGLKITGILRWRLRRIYGRRVSPLAGVPTNCPRDGRPDVRRYHTLTRCATVAPGPAICAVLASVGRHLGVQYAGKWGFRTVGIARARIKTLAREIGAFQYIDSQTQNPAVN